MSEPGRFRSKVSAAGLVAALRTDEHAPYAAMIEIADRCNETCVHCYQVQGQKGEIETDDWRRIMDELAEMGVVFLTISGGEATLRKDFLDIVRHARKRRFAVKIYTNGLSMTRALAQELAALAVQEVQISLYSHEAAIHDGVTCVPGSWEKTTAGARYLVEAGVKVVLKSPLMTVNKDGVEAYADFVRSLGCDYSMDPHLDPREDGDREPESLRIDDDALRTAMTHPMLGGMGPRDVEKPLDASLCGACSGHVHIEANGEIRPCTQLTVPVGHALEDGVRAAWESDETGRAIRSVTWRDLPACRQCDLRSHCGRCFANAKVEVDDALAPYPSACRRAAVMAEIATDRPVRVGASADRDGTVGPYRHLGDGVYEPFAPTITDDDRARARRHAWARGEAPLVQIGSSKRRRPALAPVMAVHDVD